MAKKVSSEEILRPIWTEHDDDSHEKDDGKSGKKKKTPAEKVLRDNGIYYDYHYVW